MIKQDIVLTSVIFEFTNEEGEPVEIGEDEFLTVNYEQTKPGKYFIKEMFITKKEPDVNSTPNDTSSIPDTEPNIQSGNEPNTNS